MDCYFFGTFNPPHLGHISLAKAVKAEFGFEKIIFVPAFLPPHKKTLDFIHRYNMLKLTVDNVLGQVSDIESRLATPSYSFQTVNVLYETIFGTKKARSYNKIPFIIGYDAFIDIEKWKNPDILIEKLEFIVLKRHSCTKEKDVKTEDIMALKDRGYTFRLAKNVEYYDVSSNNIRALAAQNGDISEFVDKKVEEYIYEYKLYR